MTNLQVARAFVGNALAYAGDPKTLPEKDCRCRLDTVKANLEYIDKLLEKPDEENTDHDWNDFK